jgi:hypothetical protein
MLLDSRPEGTGQALISSGLDFFAPWLIGSVSVDDYEQDWEQVMRLARSDGLLPEHDLYYPLAPAVTGLDPSVEQVLVERLQGILEAVECVARNYAKDTELQQFLNLPNFLQECALIDPHGDQYVDYCRFDLAGDQLDNIRVYEVGGDFPGSNITSGFLNSYWRKTLTIGPLIEGYQAARIEEPGWLVAELLKLGARRGVNIADTDQIALLCPEEIHFLPEVLLLKEQVRYHRRTPLCVAADQFDADGTSLGFLMYPNLPFVEDPDRYAAVLKRIANGGLIVFNGILGRAIGGNKLTLAVLSDPRFRRLFTDRQIANIDSLIPWSRKLDNGVTIHETQAQRADLVLKAPYDALSRGVHIGREQNPIQWHRLVEVGARQGWLVQEFTPSQRIVAESSCFHRTLGATFLAGRAAGYTARLSTSLRATFCPGGGMQAVFGNHAHTARAASAATKEISQLASDAPWPPSC